MTEQQELSGYQQIRQVLLDLEENLQAGGLDFENIAKLHFDVATDKIEELLAERLQKLKQDVAYTLAFKGMPLTPDQIKVLAELTKPERDS